MAFIVDFNMGGGNKLHKLAAVLDGSVDFFGECCHVGAATTIHDLYRLGAHTACATGGIHGNVTAANHNNVLAGEVGDSAVADFAQHGNGGNYARRVFAFDAELLV